MNAVNKRDLKWFTGLAAGLCLLTFTQPGAAQNVTTLNVQYQAPATCPDRATFLLLISEQMGAAITEDTTNPVAQVNMLVVATASGFEGILHGLGDERRFVDGNCIELVRAVATTIAVQLNTQQATVPVVPRAPLETFDFQLRIHGNQPDDLMNVYLVPALNPLDERWVCAVPCERGAMDGVHSVIAELGEHRHSMGFLDVDANLDVSVVIEDRGTLRTIGQILWWVSMVPIAVGFLGAVGNQADPGPWIAIGVGGGLMLGGGAVLAFQQDHTQMTSTRVPAGQ